MDNEMTMEREGRILENAINTYGIVPQVIVAIEEMSELTKALTKYLRYNECGEGEIGLITDNILEELADVSIMLSQMELIFGDITDHEIAKLERLEARLAGVRA